jgi:hypothetical protein
VGGRSDPRFADWQYGPCGVDVAKGRSLATNISVILEDTGGGDIAGRARHGR